MKNTHLERYWVLQLIYPLGERTKHSVYVSVLSSWKQVLENTYQIGVGIQVLVIYNDVRDTENPIIRNVTKMAIQCADGFDPRTSSIQEMPQ